MRQTAVGGIWVSILVSCNNFFGICKICIRTRSTVPSDVFGRQDHFFQHKQPSFLNFLCHIQICIAVGDSFEISHTNAFCTVLFDCGRVCSSTQNDFYLPVKGISIYAKIKTSNIKHQILTCLKTCYKNEKKFELEFA